MELYEFMMLSEADKFKTLKHLLEEKHDSQTIINFTIHLKNPNRQLDILEELRRQQSLNNYESIESIMKTTMLIVSIKKKLEKEIEIKIRNEKIKKTCKNPE